MFLRLTFGRKEKGSARSNTAKCGMKYRLYILVSMAKMLPRLFHLRNYLTPASPVSHNWREL